MSNGVNDYQRLEDNKLREDIYLYMLHPLFKKHYYVKLSPKMIKDFINDINLQYSYKIKMTIFSRTYLH